MLGLLRHGTVVLLAVPTTLFAVAPAPAAHPSASATTTHSTAPTSAAATSALRSPTGVLPHALPFRSGAVLPTPRSTWMPTNGQVNALASDGTYVYLGGTFTSLTNPATGQVQSHAGLARVGLLSGSADGSWNPTVTGTVESLAVRASNGTLYVGGAITFVNGVARTNLASLSTSTGAALNAFAPTTDKDVLSLLVDGSSLVIGGTFDTVNTVTRKGLARLDASTGALDTSFTPDVGGSNRSVNAIIRPQGSNAYAIGGNFTSLSTQTRPALGEVAVTNGAATSWTPSTVCPLNLSCPVISLAANRSTLFAGVGGPGGQLSAYDLGTGQRSWNVFADGNVQGLAVYGTEVYVGGHFSGSFGGPARAGLAAVDARTGTVDGGFHPTAKSVFPGTLAVLSTAAGVVTGGAQQTIGGTTQSRLAIFPPASVQIHTRLISR